MPATPRPAPTVPQDATPTRMALVVRPPEDADGNGYPDLLRVEAALFSFPDHPTAMRADGVFVFTLYRRGESSKPDARPVRVWRREGERLAAAETRAMYGLCYRFDLSLLEDGRDRGPALAADLRGRFEPAGGGDPVHTSDEVRPVQIGR
ncbi:MAG: hypothetical protein KJO43_13570 [Phycisphaerae bacterium]|nr:hypothetical protein [Phycisphaerae bacterium]